MPVCLVCDQGSHPGRIAGRYGGLSVSISRVILYCQAHRTTHYIYHTPLPALVPPYQPGPPHETPGPNTAPPSHWEAPKPKILEGSPPRYWEAPKPKVLGGFQPKIIEVSQTQDIGSLPIPRYWEAPKPKILGNSQTKGRKE